MPRRRAGLVSMAYGAALTFLVSCGATPDAPLGGAHGGGARLLGPTDGGYSNLDATYTAPVTMNAAAPIGVPGSWTHIFTTYMAEGTFGNCTHCHPDMKDAPSSYKWLDDQEYMGGSSPPLTNRGASCLSWYGGDMPPGVQLPKPEAVMEMDAWATAGGHNN